MEDHGVVNVEKSEEKTPDLISVVLYIREKDVILKAKFPMHTKQSRQHYFLSEFTRSRLNKVILIDTSKTGTYKHPCLW